MDVILGLPSPESKKDASNVELARLVLYHWVLVSDLQRLPLVLYLLHTCDTSD